MTLSDLTKYLRPLLRWWWLVVLATVLAVATSYYYLAQQPVLYQSQTTLIVGSTIQEYNPNNNQIALAQQLAELYADIAKRSAVREATQAALGLDSLPEYNVWVVPRSQMLEIHVVDTDPARAQAVALELVNQLILQTPVGNDPHARQAFITEQLNRLQASIRDTQDEIGRLEDELALAYRARDIADLRRQIDALDLKLGSMQANYAALLQNSNSGAVNSISVLEPATLPRSPIGDDSTTYVLLAALLGFSVAAAGAYAIEFVDDSIRNADEVTDHLQLNVLGRLPNMGRRNQATNLLSTGHLPYATEAYRRLRTNLQYAMTDGPCKTLLVTSSAPKDGKSLTAANLGISVAHTGKRVVLVDADLHHPQQHRLFQLPNQVGLTTALQGQETDPGRLLHPTPVPGLRVLTSGPLPMNSAELFAASSMWELLEKLQQEADLVILDSPPLTAVVDAVVLAAQADYTLLVVRMGRTRLGQARRALDALQRVNARVVGAVLNGVSRRDAAYTELVRFGYGHGVQRAGLLLAADPSSSPTMAGDASDLPHTGAPRESPMRRFIKRT